MDRDGRQIAHAFAGVMVVVALLTLAAFVVGGAQRVGWANIDGFPVGDVIDCTATSFGCDEIVGAAREALAARDPRTDIDSWTVHREGGRMRTRSQPLYVVMFRLRDGRTRALGATCGVSGCSPMQSYD
jgi:hypothetical protein